MTSQSPLEVYESAIKKGKQLCKELASFEAQPPLPASLASCGYKIESRRLNSNTENSLRLPLLSCGVLISNSTYVDVSSAGAYWAAYSNWFDPLHGLIVCNENFKIRDENSEDKKLWPPEVLWQCWKSKALEAEKRASDLCAVMRLCIVNDASQIAIWQASQHSSFSRIDKNNQVEYTSQDNGFYAILGSPNGANTMRMLRDHRTELGHRVVEKVVVLGKKGLTMGMPETRDMVILLSDRRKPLSRIPIRVFSSRRIPPSRIPVPVSSSSRHTS
jgi:hypothetical protein